MAITFSKDRSIFSLDTQSSSYVFAIENGEHVRHLYWGPKVRNAADFQIRPVERVDSQDAAIDTMAEEYPPFGGLRYKTTAIKPRFPDGTRDLVFRFVEHSVRDGNELVIHLRDAHHKLFVDLHYRLYDDLNVIKRWVEVENRTSADVELSTLASAYFNLPGTDYFYSQVTGHWSAEHQIFRERLQPGRADFQCRKGLTGNTHSPYFILDRGATEERGEVYFGALAYGGNWNVTIESTQFHWVRVALGINSFDFALRLKKGERFATPAVFAGFTELGFSQMSHTMNDLARQIVLPQRARERIHPVLFNSWEATKFDISVHQQIALAKKAAKVGVELFVVDDGWFGQRNSDQAGLGDWVANKKKFPKGLKELTTAVNKLGMEFGLWIEPEMVNPDSNLYRKHPDWIYEFKNRTPTTARNQLVLNLTRPEVQKYLFSVIDALLTENNIAYIKWDMNRPISEPGARNLAPADQCSLWLRHTEAVYELVDALRAKHPHVTFEGCASGGGRIDYGTLGHFDQIWLSDNTDATDRLLIQEGYSYLYPIKAMRAWVTDVPNKITKKSTPLEFRFHSAMCGTLGLGGNLTNYTQKELALCAQKVAEYKRIRHIVQDGHVYRLKSIANGRFHAVQYVYRQAESVLFVFLTAQKYIESNYAVRLRGLDPARRYEVVRREDKFVAFGDYLMNVGISLKMMGDYVSELIHLRATS